MKILSGHTNQDNAYVVDDYPYGFRLRCKIRYWLEYRDGRGFRLVSQTTNPKIPMEIWNKPKASTYNLVGVMILDDQGHVTWTTLGYGTTKQQLAAFNSIYGEALDENGQKQLRMLERLAS